MSKWDDWTNRQHRQLDLELRDKDDLAPARGIVFGVVISVIIYVIIFLGVRS